MRDPDCVELMQWLLPRCGLRWEGFRRVRGQVCKRLARRLSALGLPDGPTYRRFVEAHPDELAVVDELCRVSISRFYRDRGVFDALRDRILTGLAGEVLARGDARLRVWSAGCAGGEEPYTLALIWRFALRPAFPRLAFEVVASDADPVALERARRACYRWSSLKELPAAWRRDGFVARDGLFSLTDELRSPVELRCEDLRTHAPDGSFQLILCRNLGFTYFAEAEQRALLSRLVSRLAPRGVLVIGAREHLPPGHPFRPDQSLPGVFFLDGEDPPVGRSDVGQRDRPAGNE
jgi:chemotaxis protein methyltransferase CheR